QLEHMLQPPAKRGAVAPKPGHFAEADVPRRTVEFLAEQVGNESIVAELHQLAAEAFFQVRDTHHRRDQDNRRPRLSVSSPDERALEILAFEFMRNCAFLAHDISFNSSASFA